MNPRTVLWQSLANAAILSLMIAFASPPLAIWLAAVGLVVSVALNAGYAHALATQGRSRRRVLGDHLVASYIAISLAAPLLAAVLADAEGVRPGTTFWGFRHAEIEAILTTTGALFLAVLLSSLIDWYYIRPRIDGVVCAPPCLATKDHKGPWKRVTRRWYIHRGLATFSYILFAIAIAFIVMIMLVREDRAAAGVIGGVSGIAGLLLIFAGPYRNELPTVAKWALSPAFVLGDDLEFEGLRNKTKRGYVLHVAVPVVKLVPLDENGQPIDAPFIEPKNSQLSEAELMPKPTIACRHGCAELNPECLRRHVKANHRIDRRRRLLIF
jgi:hypothetical protein